MSFGIGCFVATVLCLLSALHVYWALGGRGSFAAAIPEVSGRRALTPGPFMTLGVALALLLAALIVATRVGLWNAPPLPTLLARWGTWTVAAVFLARAIGDFRLFGFAKRVRGTRFARWDTRLYSPLCAALGLAMLWIAMR